MTKTATISGLAKRLVQDNLLSETEAIRANQLAQKENLTLVHLLASRHKVNSLQLASIAAREFGLPLLNLSAMDLSDLPTHLVSNKLIARHRVLPLRQSGKRLHIGLSDPSDHNAINEIKFHTGIHTDLVVVEDDKLNRVIDELLTSTEHAAADLSDLEDINLENIEAQSGTDTSDEPEDSGVDEKPIVRFVNKILFDAIRQGASDIHVEPYEKIYRVRFRQDGMLKEVARPPKSITNRVASRLKIMARMDISEKRIPQDGRIKLKLSSSRAIDFRVNTLPTLWGEKIVLRLLDPSSAQLGVDALGFEKEQKQHYLDALTRSQGMILVTGPTGSGKTVSLYTGLNILNTLERNISTAEDPVEINLEGINQVAINPRVGLDFAAALRAFLRQDPDVIMVGEIRDLETAEIAVKAAQTGHLVLSTLHTNSAPETLTRLRNMGVPSYNIATSVNLVIAQRLARRLCNHCKQALKLPARVLLEEGFQEAQLDHLELFTANGCDKCHNGYKGRVGIYQVMPVTDAIARIIMDDGNSIQIADKAREEGFNDLRASALLKVAQGITSLAEINRIT